jgi:hypothetical protein
MQKVKHKYQIDRERYKEMEGRAVLNYKATIDLA